MTVYELTQGYGDLITCDECSDLAGAWYTDGSHAICEDCGDHYKQTTEGERTMTICGDHLIPIRECGCKL